ERDGERVGERERELEFYVRIEKVKFARPVCSDPVLGGVPGSEGGSFGRLRDLRGWRIGWTGLYVCAVEWVMNWRRRCGGARVC
ncbi:hypothetical protein M758_5G026900, partial [Ceratodon purpureus]